MFNRMIVLLLYLIASPSAFSFFPTTANTEKTTIIRVIEKDLLVNGKSSKVFHIEQPDGTFGYYGIEGNEFNVTVENKTKVPLVLHWHGLIDPNPDDGVPYVTQLPIQPNQSYHYQFKLKQSGTYWFHSHYKLQEQQLMAAPLIIHKQTPSKEKEVLMFVQDFTFRDPKVIYEELRKNLVDQNTKMRMSMPPSAKPAATGENVPMKNMQMDQSSQPSTNGTMQIQMQKTKMQMPMKMSMDVSDVKFDAYLTNHKTLSNPDVIRVGTNEDVLLRIINASASSNYFVDLGKLEGTLVAVDGEPIKPIVGTRFQMAIGNRLDIRVRVPETGAYPILALPEGTRQQTGLILATEHAAIPKLPETTKTTNAVLDYSQELKLSAQDPFQAHSPEQTLNYKLAGDMQTYHWTINGQEWPHITPFKVKPKQRVELVFNNISMMAHPMHIHGHVFQVSEVNGQKLNGRKGDTVNVMPNSTMKVFLDTDNPGIWMLHCHILYHQKGGMMTTVNYEGYPERFTMQQRLEGDKLYYQSLTPVSSTSKKE